MNKSWWLDNNMARLVLIRHGESLWNQKGLWTGLTDISLNQKGEEEAKRAAHLIKDVHFDNAFISQLRRSKETYEIIEKELKFKLVPTVAAAFNERDYGDYTGENKWEIQKKVGDEEFLKIRRGWNHPIPHGESLKDVYDRVKPYYEEKVEPLLKEGKNILIVAHGNSLRALIKLIENISDADIPHLELATGEIYLYDINNQGKVVDKKILKS